MRDCDIHFQKIMSYLILLWNIKHNIGGNRKRSSKDDCLPATLSLFIDSQFFSSDCNLSDILIAKVTNHKWCTMDEDSSLRTLSLSCFLKRNITIRSHLYISKFFPLPFNSILNSMVRGLRPSVYTGFYAFYLLRQSFYLQTKGSHL